jgi:hypothetical protein
VNLHPFFPLEQNLSSSKYAENQSQKKLGRREQKLTNKPPVLGFQTIYDGISTRDLLRNFVAQSIFSFVEPLTKIFSSSGISFSFLAGLFALFKLKSKLFSVFFSSIEVL